MNNPIRISRQQKKDCTHIHKRGQILSWTRIHTAPSRFASQTPYIVLLVKLESGQRVYGQYCDYDEKDIVIGKEVLSILRRVAQPDPEELVEYGIKFKPYRP